MNAIAPSCQGVHVEVRTQHCGNDLLRLLLDEFCRLSSYHWTFAASDFYTSSHLSGPLMIILKLTVGS